MRKQRLHVLSTALVFAMATVCWVSSSFLIVNAFPVATSTKSNAAHISSSSRLSATRDDTRSRRRAGSSKKTFKTFENMLDAFRDELVIVYFTKHTCGPCLLQQRELWAVRGRLPAAVLTIDAAKWPAIATRYHVGKLPCLLVVKQQHVVARLEGLTTGNDLLQHLAIHATTEKESDGFDGDDSFGTERGDA